MILETQCEKLRWYFQYIQPQIVSALQHIVNIAEA